VGPLSWVTQPNPLELKRAVLQLLVHDDMSAFLQILVLRIALHRAANYMVQNSRSAVQDPRDCS
jgi:hypothetical protein